MRNLRQEWRQLSGCIAEKIEEYISESACWDGEVFIWIDGNNFDVNLGIDGENYPGERHLVSFFIMADDDGNLSLDYDKIDDFASGWFDFRQG